MPVSAPRWLTAPARWSVAAQTFALQVLVALLVVGVGTAAAYAQAQRAGTQEATARATAVAETVASTPSVIAGVRSGRPGPPCRTSPRTSAGRRAPTSSSS